MSSNKMDIDLNGQQYKSMMAKYEREFDLPEITTPNERSPFDVDRGYINVLKKKVKSRDDVPIANR